MKKSITNFLKWVGIFIAVYLLGSICFAVLFHTPVLRSMEVLMYRGIGLLLISGAVVVILLLLVRRYIYTKLEGKDIAIMFMMFCCVNMVLFTLIPVTVERSVSVFMLSYMSDHQSEAYTQDEIEEVFEEYYVDKYGAFEKRFKEQEVTGTIEETEDGYEITSKGKLLVSMFRGIAKLFDIDERLLYSEDK